MRRYRRHAVGLGVLAVIAAACGDRQSILDAGNTAKTVPPVIATPSPATAAPGQTRPPAPATTTTIPPSTTATPLANLPTCPTAALASAAGPIDITFWHGMNGGLQDTLVALTDAYNASQTKVHVSLENQGGYEQVIDKFVPASVDSRPDIVQTSEYSLQQIIDLKSTVPIGACIESSGFDTSKFLPKVLDYYATEGVQWTMPFNVSNPVLYYNRVMFAKAGLDPENPPKTLEELRAASDAIVKSGAAKYGIAFDTGFDNGGGWFIEQWFTKLGQLYADNGNGRLAPATKVLVDTPKSVDLLKYVQQMILDGVAFNVGDNATGQANFLKLADPQEPAAMTIGTSAALGTVKSVLDGGLIPGLTSKDIGVGPMPGPQGNPGVNVGGASLWIVDGKGDAKTAASWDYIKFLVSAQSQSTWAAGTGYVPIRSDALTLAPIAQTYVDDPRFKVAYDQLVQTSDDLSAVGPVVGPLREIRVVVAQAVSEIFNGADVTTSLTNAAAQSDRLITDYTARNGGG